MVFFRVKMLRITGQTNAQWSCFWIPQLSMDGTPHGQSSSALDYAKVLERVQNVENSGAVVGLVVPRKHFRRRLYTGFDEQDRVHQ